MISELSLIEPAREWESAFLDMAAEFAASNDHRYQAAIDDFTAYLARRQEFARGSDLPPSYVPETTYWGVEEMRIVGGVRVRHHLTPALRQFGGHIGYDVRPSKRGQGYGTRLLALALERAWQRGLRQVLLTCDRDNIGSARVIEKNGGKLSEEGMVAGYDKVVLRYWIDLSAEECLRQLDSLHTKGLITEAEYAQRRQQLIESV